MALATKPQSFFFTHASLSSSPLSSISSQIPLHHIITYSNQSRKLNIYERSLMASAPADHTPLASAASPTTPLPLALQGTRITTPSSMGTKRTRSDTTSQIPSVTPGFSECTKAQIRNQYDDHCWHCGITRTLACYVIGRDPSVGYLSLVYNHQ